MLGKGALDWLRAYDADVICLQEVKARPDQLDEGALSFFADYQQIWNPALRPGYSGNETGSETYHGD